MKKLVHTLSSLPFFASFLRSIKPPTRQVEHTPPVYRSLSNTTASCWIFTEEFSGATVTIDRSTSQCLQWRGPAGNASGD